MRIRHQQARASFAEARTAHLATANADSTPHLVPVVCVTTGDRIATAVDWKPGPGSRVNFARN